MATTDSVVGFMHETALAAGQTRYVAPGGDLDATYNTAKGVWPVAGNASSMYIELDQAPGAGESVTVTLMISGAAQTLAVTISDTATTGNNTINTNALAAGDDWAVRLVASATAADMLAGIAFKFVPT